MKEFVVVEREREYWLLIQSLFHTHSTCTPPSPHPHPYTPHFLLDKYKFLISGEAKLDVDTFLESDHTLQEYKEKIDSYRSVAREISGLDDVLIFQMFRLECHDIKHGLTTLAQKMGSRLVGHLAKKHIEENKRCVYMGRMGACFELQVI